MHATAYLYNIFLKMNKYTKTCINMQLLVMPYAHTYEYVRSVKDGI